MMAKNKQQVKLLPLQWAASCTCDALSSDLDFFTFVMTALTALEWVGLLL